ncbi:MAG: MerR family DNA-binding protein [Tolypothrix carrinoi HA7290-LM1]|jgi:DNA-binding transcriptional MerR regulator|nr:MerR family DNA-binding protein [Tolypothrix carrinoi HA7290-LM1]
MLVQEHLQRIGSIAKQSGIPVKTIRYYEELGLVQSSTRTEGGFRLFQLDVLTRLNFIKRAQSLNFSLSEIKFFLDVHDQGDLPCQHIRSQMEYKLSEINQQIEQLSLLKLELEELLLGWRVITKKPEKTICPIIEKCC